MYKFLMTCTKNFLKATFTGSRALEPLFPLYHVTPFCNLKCSYCDGLSEKKNREESQLSTIDVKKVLDILRNKFDHIFFTGGEPFIRDDIDEILYYARTQQFKKIAINTNSLLLHEKENCLHTVDELSISLDSLDEKYYDEILGLHGASREIIENVLRYAQLQKKYGYVLTVHCVIIPNGIAHAYHVLWFCLDNQIQVCLSPLVVNYAPHPALIDNLEYKELIRKIIELKKKTNLISGTLLFFDSIMEFEPYICYPFLIPRIFPMGELLYPCRPLGEKRNRVSLLDTGSWEQTERIAAKSFGTLNSCERSCRIRCYIEPSLLIKRPWSMIPEYFYQNR